MLSKMITTINNSHRIFFVLGDQNTSYLCNLEDLERVYLSFDDIDGVKIQHRWNGRFVRCSKKLIVDMLKGMNLNYKFL